MTQAITPAATRIPGQRTGESSAEESRQLVERFQAGDPDAFTAIYRRYSDMVFRFVYFRSNGNRLLAEDLTQDTFTKALRRLGRWEWQGKDLGAWLVTVARNLANDHVKRAEQKRAVSVPDFSGLAERPDLGREGDPEAAVIAHQRDVEVLSALRYLTADQRTVLIHRFLEEMSVAETAAAMGREEGAIKSLQYRAVRTLDKAGLGGWR